MHMDRRQFVKNLGLGTASLSMGSLVTASSCAPSGDSSLKQNVKEGEDGQFLFIGDDIAIAQTEYGKVQGYLLNHVYTFLGVPYGADTSGKNRFMPPPKTRAVDRCETCGFLWEYGAATYGEPVAQ